MQLANTTIQYEESSDRLKITYQLKPNWAWTITYSVLMLIWLGLFFLFLRYLFWPSEPRNWESLPAFVRFFYYLMIGLWLWVWVRYLGRTLWRGAQFYWAVRETLYLDQEKMIVRRPISIFGLSDAYARVHLSPFYKAVKHDALAFQYGNAQHILLAMGLESAEQDALLAFLNQRFFPNRIEEDDDDEG